MRRRPSILATTAAVLILAGTAIVSVSGGCSGYEDDGYDDRDRRGDRFDDRGGDYYVGDDGRRYRDRDEWERRRARDDWDRDRDGDGNREWDRDRRDDDRERDRDEDWTRIPRDADLVANGDRALAYSAAHDGRLYVRDERTSKVIYAGRVRAGQKLTIDPGRRGIMLDGRTVKDELDNRPREREVFFRPDRGAQPRLEPAKGGKGKTDRVVP